MTDGSFMAGRFFMNKVITISRQFGSGGREFGIKLAHAFGIPFYDKDLISMAAEDSNLSPEFMKHYEESAPGLFSLSAYRSAPAANSLP